MESDESKEDRFKGAVIRFVSIDLKVVDEVTSPASPLPFLI